MASESKKRKVSKTLDKKGSDKFLSNRRSSRGCAGFNSSKRQNIKNQSRNEIQSKEDDANLKHLESFKKFNENNNSDLSISGLKCDNPKCDYKDDSVKFEDYVNYIDKECPKCGESLLTQEDYDSVVNIVDAVDIMNMYSPDDLDKISSGLSEEEIDSALDMLNQLKLVKNGVDDRGREIWKSRDKSNEEYIYDNEDEKAPEISFLNDFADTISELRDRVNRYGFTTTKDLEFVKRLMSNFD